MNTSPDTGSGGSGSSRSEHPTDGEASASSVPAVRDRAGRFLPGNREGRRGGPGSYIARKAFRLRRELYRAVTAADIADIAQRLVRDAKTGDNEATRMLFDYCIGKPALPEALFAHDPDNAPRIVIELGNRHAPPTLDVGPT